MTCPVCHGSGADPAGWPDTVPRPSPDAKPKCWCCRGSGELPEGARWEPELGRRNRARRILVGASLCDFAKAYGISAARLSEQERGLWRKE